MNGAPRLQLRQPRRHARDDPAPQRRARPVRRRRALRRDLRRVASPRSCSRTGPATATAGERLPLELVVQKQTRDTAALYGLGDRGVVAPGLQGRPQRDRLRRGCRCALPELVHDLPGGARRLIQRADGYRSHVRRRRRDHARRRGDRRPSRQARAGHAMSPADVSSGGDVLLETPVARERVTAVKIPVSRYTSPGVLRARDDRRVAAGVAARVHRRPRRRRPATGSSTAWATISVLIVRGDDGVLRAFQNVCLHRGSELCSGSGSELARDPLPVPPVDVGPRRPAARGAVAPRVRRAQRRLPADRRAGRHLGPDGVREPRPRRRVRSPSILDARAGRDRVGRPRRVPLPGAASR